MKKTISQEIKETEAKLEELRKKKVLEDDKSNWIKIPKLNLEIQNKIHDKGKSYDELVKKYGKKFLEENMPKHSELQFLRNLENKGKVKLGLIDTYEFVKQEDEISKKNGYVAGFCAYSGVCNLICDWDSRVSYSNLGVRFVRRKKK